MDKNKKENLEEEPSLGMAELLEKQRTHIIRPIESYDFPTSYSQGLIRGFYHDEPSA